MPQPYQLPDLIAARLTGAGVGVPVLYAPDLAGILLTQISPALYVVSAGIKFVSSHGAEVSLRETVYVVACTRYANQSGAQGSRQLAMPYLNTVITALLDHAFDGYSPLEFETPPLPRATDDFAYYPLQFAANYGAPE